MNSRILQSLRAISPNAEDFVRVSGAVVLWAADPSQAPACIVRAKADNMGIVFASLEANTPHNVRIILLEALKDLINEAGLAERCFNCRGDDQASRELAKKQGFKLEMAGYFMTRSDPPRNLSPLSGLRAYCEDDLDNWLLMTQSCYRELCLENGWESQSYDNPASFGSDMLQRVIRNEAWSYLEQGKLIGGYRLNGSFIEDILVLPEHQNRGLGSQLLECAVAQVMQNGFAEVNLRVAESNTGALRLYQRRQFVLVSHFAEHCY